MGTLNEGEANLSSPAEFNSISKPRAGVLELSRLTARHSLLVRNWE